MFKCKTHGYTLDIKCRVCNKTTTKVQLPKFSIEDKYGKQRRKAKMEDKVS